MKEDALNKKIELFFEEYKKFWSLNAWWGGVSELSSIYNCICSVLVSKELKNLWFPKIMEPHLSREIIESLKSSFNRRYKNIEWITSIGDKFNDDEFLLFLTTHTELCLIKEYLEAREIQCPNLNLSQTEEKIKFFGKMKVNQKDYDIALSLIRKNWGLPLTTAWTI